MISENSFFGSATIGEKGQIVIPVEARNKLGLKIGEKMLVLSAPGGNGLLVVKPDVLQSMMTEMNKKFKDLNAKINNKGAK